MNNMLDFDLFDPLTTEEAEWLDKNYDYVDRDGESFILNVLDQFNTTLDGKKIVDNGVPKLLREPLKTARSHNSKYVLFNTYT